MLKLTLDNTVVDLLDNELSIVQTSPYPLVAVGTSGGNFVFNFNLPATDELKRIFKFYHRPQSKNHTAEVPFRIDANGLVYEGLSKVTEANSKQYEIFCPVGNGNFNKAIKELKINEIDLGGDRSLISTLQCVDANLIESITYVLLASPDSFEETIIPSFSNVTVNTGGLNTEGTQFINTNPRGNLRLLFTFNSLRIYGVLRFKVYLNGQSIKDIYIDGDSQEEIIVLAETNSVISWDLLVQNEVSNTPDLFNLDATIYASSKLQIYYAQVLNTTDRYPTTDFALFPVENPEVFANWDDDFYSIDNLSIKTLYAQYFKVINYYKDDCFPIMLSGILEGVDYSAGNIITPFPYLAYLIKRIAYHFNLKIENNPFENELKYVVLINHFCENEFLSDNTKLITPKQGFNLQDHVPDMTIYDFLKNLCNLFGLGYEVNNERSTIAFNFLDDIIKNKEFEDISHLVVDEIQVIESDVKGAKIMYKVPTNDKYFSNVNDLEGLVFKGILNTYFDLPNPGTLNDCYFVKLSNAYYAWKYNPDTYQFGWVIHSYNYIRVKEIGEDQKEISPELVPVMMKYVIKDDTLGAPEGRQWLIPASHQAGRFEGAPETFQTKWQGLLSYYHGMFPSYPSGTYPFGSPDIYDLWGNPIPGLELSLKLDGENGIYEKKWKRYLEWRSTAIPVRVKIIPDRKFLQNLLFSKKKMINGVKYLLVEFRGNISKDGPKVAELTLLAL